MGLRVRKGDKIVVTAGRDKGKIGKILKVIPSQNQVVVEGVNLVKKHIRRRSENEPGGIKEIPLPFSISKVSLFCPQCNRGVRFAIKIADDKSKIRICKRCQHPF